MAARRSPQLAPSLWAANRGALEQALWQASGFVEGV
jgi:hypothetical protein